MVYLICDPPSQRCKRSLHRSDRQTPEYNDRSNPCNVLLSHQNEICYIKLRLFVAQPIVITVVMIIICAFIKWKLKNLTFTAQKRTIPTPSFNQRQQPSSCLRLIGVYNKQCKRRGAYGRWRVRGQHNGIEAPPSPILQGERRGTERVAERDCLRTFGYVILTIIVVWGRNGEEVPCGVRGKLSVWGRAWGSTKKKGGNIMAKERERARELWCDPNRPVIASRWWQC